MPIIVKFSCSGCEAETEVKGENLRVRECAPDGWMPFDPYTKQCYCPKCWRDIDES